MPAIVGIGPIEIAILLAMLGVPLALALVIVALRGRRGYPTPQPCPRCGQPIVPLSRFCHHCGEQLRQ